MENESVEPILKSLIFGNDPGIDDTVFEGVVIIYAGGSKGEPDIWRAGLPHDAGQYLSEFLKPLQEKWVRVRIEVIENADEYLGYG